MTNHLTILLALIATTPLSGRAGREPQGDPAITAALPERPVKWSAAVAGPTRADLERALDKPLAYPWHMFDRKTKQRHEARTCAALMALDPTCQPMDADDEGDSSPTELSDSDWNIYDEYLVGCRAVVVIQKAKPARVDYLGSFPLDNARLAEIPAAVMPTPSDEEEKRLTKASARGVSWKKWDRRIHVTKTHHGGITVESSDTNCFLSVYGRGDFNGDGIEDVLLWRSGGGQDGTWGSSAGFVLTRRSPHGGVEIVKIIR